MRPFKGTLVVTDSCYLMKRNPDHKNDWVKCWYGDNMEILGIKDYECRNTIYGNWSCKFFEAGSLKETNYAFCADTGLVIVTTLEEIEKYNPDFKKWALAHNWCVAMIPNFDGKAGIEEFEEYDKDDEYLGQAVRVVTHGSHELVSFQTGL